MADVFERNGYQPARQDGEGHLCGYGQALTWLAG